MRGKEFLDIRVRENGILRERALHFEVALHQTIDSSYQRCRHAMSILHGLCRFLEAESQHHFWLQESVLYPAIQGKLPRLRRLLDELRHEYDIFRQALEDFRRELVHSNLTGQLRSLPRSGGELINILRCYLDHEDDELHSVILKEFEDEDLPEARANA